MKRGGGKRAQRNEALLAALKAGDLAGAQQAVGRAPIRAATMTSRFA